MKKNISNPKKLGIVLDLYKHFIKGISLAKNFIKNCSTLHLLHLLQDTALEKRCDGREARSGHSLEIQKADCEACGQTWCVMSGNQKNRELDQYFGIKAGSQKPSYYCQGEPREQYFHHSAPLCPSVLAPQLHNAHHSDFRQHTVEALFNRIKQKLLLCICLLFFSTFMRCELYNASNNAIDFIVD